MSGARALGLKPGSDPGIDLLDRLILEKKIQEERSKALYAISDAENVRRRAELDVESRLVEEEARLLSPVLSAIDELEEAVQRLSGCEGASEGIAMIVANLKRGLAQVGVEEVPGVGSKFDPQFHEAVRSEQSSLPEGIVCGVLRRGYKARGRVIRPALVVISAGEEVSPKTI